MPSILRQLTKELGSALDAQVLLAHITGKTRAWLLAHPELKLSPAQEKKLQEIYKAVYLAMPIKSYVWKHPEASLSQEDKNLLRQWTGKAPF